MKSFATCQNIQYAIIRASSTHDSPELVVLAYADVKWLRSLIAQPSIMALGFVSRSAADAGLQETFRSQHMNAISAIKKAEYKKLSLAIHFSRSRLTDILTYLKGFSHLYRALQLMFATAVLVMYSKNFVATTIRTALVI